MKNKFRFLTKDSIKKKVCTKSFRIINIVLLIIIVGLVNLDSIVKLFGGDFEDKINVYVIDNVGIYNELETTLDSGYKDILDSYNTEIKASDKSIDELKEDIIKDETKDVIINIKKVDNVSLDKMFDAEVISYEKIDKLLYQDIINALNTTKANMALKKANISSELLNSIYNPVEIDRIYLNEDMNDNQELIEMIATVLIIVFILPFFILILLIVQMIGAEINEEKSTKSMEVIISSVSPQVHFMSKLISANVFAVLQGILLILYSVIGIVIRLLTTGTSGVGSVVGASEVGKISEYINMFTSSELATRLVSGIPFFIILILLSFFAYSLFIGVLASMTTNMEDYNQIQTPVMIFLMIGYYLAIFA